MVAHGVWDPHCPCSCPMSWFGPCGEQGCVPCDTPRHHPSHLQSRVSGMSPVSAVLSRQGSRDMSPQYVPSATCFVCTVPSTHESRDMSLAPRAIAGTSRVRCPFLPWEQGCVPMTCAAGATALPQELDVPRTLAFGDVPHVPSCCGNRDMSPVPHQVHVPRALSHHPAGSGTFLHATCYWGHIPPVEQRGVISPCHVPPGHIHAMWSHPMAHVPPPSLQT